MSTRFEARWPIEPGTESVPFTARVRVAKGDLDQLLEEAGAELLCHPDVLTWREDNGELVATGPARRKTTTTQTPAQEAA
ncbi:hypothetical protein ACFS27_03255 [Promicromonospora vindobonensis]|uniref:Uncharacterized protein n=1 Tax=Promicromonospora vindobonensis TaxID=195748 RepID=A0ABW5VLK3_9MICO